MSKKKPQPKHKRYCIKLIDPFEWFPIYVIGVTNSKGYAHRRAVEWSHSYPDCFVRVEDTEPIPHHITVYQNGMQLQRPESEGQS